MIQIILSDEQVKTAHEAKQGVELRDKHGTLVGYLHPPPSDEMIAEAKRRLHSDGPWYTTKQVLNHLESLEQE